MTADIKLSKRMKQLLSLLAQGMPNEQIAQEIGISTHTVKVHLWRLYKRIDVNSRGLAIKWWHDNQPSSMPFALRAAFDSPCRLLDKLKAGEHIGVGEFEHYRYMVQRMEGGPA